MKAYCWADGRIEFGRTQPRGSRHITKAPARVLTAAVGMAARHSRTNNDLFVPGIPEADTKVQKYAALLEFRRQVAKRISK